jgi:hypothetical protein
MFLIFLFCCQILWEKNQKKKSLMVVISKALLSINDLGVVSYDHSP